MCDGFLHEKMFVVYCCVLADVMSLCYAALLTFGIESDRGRDLTYCVC